MRNPNGFYLREITGFKEDLLNILSRLSALSNGQLGMEGGGFLPDSSIKTIKKKVTTFEEMDWQSAVVIAMSIVAPCSLREISEEIWVQNKGLQLLAIHKHLKNVVGLMVASGLIGVLPNKKQKYFLK